MTLYKTNKDNKLQPVKKVNIHHSELKQTIENNLETLLQLKYIRSNFKINNTLIDTLAYDEKTKTPVLIKYPEGNLNYTQEEQKYTQIIKENKNHIIEEYKKYDENTTINLENPKIIHIAQKYQNTNINTKHTELWKLTKFNNETILLEKIHPKTQTQDNTLATNDDGIKEYRESDHLKNKPYTIVKFYNQLKNKINTEFENIEIIATKNYISYRLNERFNNKTKRKNLIIIQIQRNQLNIQIGMKKGTLKDPKNITIDTTNNKTYKNNDYQVKLHPEDNLDDFIEIFKQTYQNQIKGEKE